MTTNIKMQPVESSNLKAIGYNPNTKELFVEMKNNNALYKYQDVSLETYQNFFESNSKGSFFAKEIRNKFNTTKIDKP